MHIGIIADTHDRLPVIEKALSIFKKRDITTILHAGDFISPFTVPLFKDFEMYGVFGNNDGEKAGLTNAFENIHAVVVQYFCEVELDNTKIAITHGHIGPLLDLLVNSPYDVVVTGHTHEPDILYNNPIIINPGECCGYLSNQCTAVIFDTGKKKGEIIEIY
ncbi:MAG: metallophosphoesterase [Candidatus Methanofastidiosia archaeon]